MISAAHFTLPPVKCDDARAPPLDAAGLGLMRVRAMVTITAMGGSFIRSRTPLLALALLLNGCAGPWLQSSPPIADNAAAAVTLPAITETPAPAAVEPTVAPSYSDTWKRLASEFTWPHYANGAVASARRKLTEHPQGFERATARARPFLWFIADAIAARGLPAELALLPLIESGFRPRAHSPYGAAGIWQFMPATGHRFGLKQSRYYDARRDVVASTHAALDYLARLNEQFEGNWLLAVAAYNCGPATVQRAIRKRGARDFWAIVADLPLETRRHVPKLLAAVEIVGDPERYNVSLSPIANAPYFVEIDLGGPVDLDFLTAVDGWSEAQFEELNPAFKRNHTDPEGPFRILAPIALNGPITAALAAVEPDQRMSVRTHVVRSGDTLSQIAAHYAVDVNTLRRRNKINGNLIRVGTELIVRAPPDARRTDQGTAAASQRHVVKRGDSFWTLARRYNTTAHNIADLNELSLKQLIYPGQTLLISRDARQVSRYAVKAGDSLWTIARKFRVSVDQLKRWNNLSARKPLQPGQSLIVSGPLSGRLKKT